MPAAILGDRAAGKTTFIVLLYNAQVRYTNYPENKDKFRFHASAKALNFAAEQYKQMKMGEWPAASISGQQLELNFLFGYRKMGSDLIPNWVVKRDWISPFYTVKFNVFDVAGEDVLDMIEAAKTPEGIMGNLQQDVKNLLESRILVILVDVSRIAAKPRTPEFKSMLEYDKNMATLVSLVAEYNSKKPDPKLRRIFPVIVLTKFDTLEARGNILRQLNLPETIPAFKNMDDRRKFAETIMRAYYPNMLAQLKGAGLIKVSFDEAIYIFSGVRTEFDDKGLPRPKLKEGSPPELDFEYKEYETFIEAFKYIAKEMPDDIVEEKMIDKIISTATV